MDGSLQEARIYGHGGSNGTLRSANSEVNIHPSLQGYVRSSTISRVVPQRDSTLSSRSTSESHLNTNNHGTLSSHGGPSANSTLERGGRPTSARSALEINHGYHGTNGQNGQNGQHGTLTKHTNPAPRVPIKPAITAPTVDSGFLSQRDILYPLRETGTNLSPKPSILKSPGSRTLERKTVSVNTGQSTIVHVREPADNHIESVIASPPQPDFDDLDSELSQNQSTLSKVYSTVIPLNDPRLAHGHYVQDSDSVLSQATSNGNSLLLDNNDDTASSYLSYQANNGDSSNSVLQRPLVSSVFLPPNLSESEPKRIPRGHNEKRLSSLGEVAASTYRSNDGVFKIAIGDTDNSSVSSVSDIHKVNRSETVTLKGKIREQSPTRRSPRHVPIPIVIEGSPVARNRHSDVPSLQRPGGGRDSRSVTRDHDNYSDHDYYGDRGDFIDSGNVEYVAKRHHARDRGSHGDVSPQRAHRRSKAKSPPKEKVRSSRPTSSRTSREMSEHVSSRPTSSRTSREMHEQISSRPASSRTSREMSEHISSRPASSKTSREMHEHVSSRPASSRTSREMHEHVSRPASSRTSREMSEHISSRPASSRTSREMSEHISSRPASSRTSREMHEHVSRPASSRKSKEMLEHISSRAGSSREMSDYLSSSRATSGQSLGGSLAATSREISGHSTVQDIESKHFSPSEISPERVSTKPSISSKASSASAVIKERGISMHSPTRFISISRLSGTKNPSSRQSSMSSRSVSSGVLPHQREFKGKGILKSSNNHSVQTSTQHSQVLNNVQRPVSFTSASARVVPGDDGSERYFPIAVQYESPSEYSIGEHSEHSDIDSVRSSSSVTSGYSERTASTTPSASYYSSESYSSTPSGSVSYHSSDSQASSQYRHTNTASEPLDRLVSKVRIGRS